MKYVIFCVFSLVLLQYAASAQSTWKSPTYKAEAYRKVIIMAKISDDLAKRQLEDATVKLLKEKGMEAIPSYSAITDADLVSEEAFMVKADSLQADALIVYTVAGTETTYKNTPSVDAYVGVPVRIGIFRGSIGGNVPLAGGARSVSVVRVTSGFYNRSSKDLLWSGPLQGKLKKGTAKLASDFAKTTVNALVKDRMFLAE